MAVGDIPAGGGTPKRPYRFEGILVAATRFDRAAEVEPREERGRASTTPDPLERGEPTRPFEGQPFEGQPLEGSRRLERSLPVQRPAPPEPTDRGEAQGPLFGFEPGSEQAHGSRRWLLMALVALLASTLVLALVDLRPGVDPGESPARCAPEALQRDLGTVDGIDFVIDERRCSGGFAYLRLEPVVPGPDPVFVAAEHLEGSWRALHHGWVRDCQAVETAAGGDFPTELCEAMGA